MKPEGVVEIRGELWNAISTWPAGREVLYKGRKRRDRVRLLGKDVEDQLGAVDHLEVGLLGNGVDLARCQVLVKADHVCAGLQGPDDHIFKPAFLLIGFYYLGELLDNPAQARAIGSSLWR